MPKNSHLSPRRKGDEKGNIDGYSADVPREDVPVLGHLRFNYSFFQENARNITHHLEMVGIMLLRLQCNVFMLSYRGYGVSDEFFLQRGITKDTQAALDHLVQRTNIDTSKIVVLGRSLEGTVRSVLTINNPDKHVALISKNTFTSTLDMGHMAGVLWPFLKWFIGKSSSKGPGVLNFLIHSP